MELAQEFELAKMRMDVARLTRSQLIDLILESARLATIKVKILAILSAGQTTLTASAFSLSIEQQLEIQSIFIDLEEQDDSALRKILLALMERLLNIDSALKETLREVLG
jgi:hypothetical protein